MSYLFHEVELMLQIVYDMFVVAVVDGMSQTCVQIEIGGGQLTSQTLLQILPQSDQNWNQLFFNLKISNQK